MSKSCLILFALAVAPAPSHSLIGQYPLSMPGSEPALGHALQQLPTLAAPIFGSMSLVSAGLATMLGLQGASEPTSGGGLTTHSGSRAALDPVAEFARNELAECNAWCGSDEDCRRGCSATHTRGWGERQRESAAIYQLAADNKVDEAVLRLEAMLRSTGTDPALSTCNAVLFALARAERPDDAAALLAGLPRINAASHNALLHGYARARRRDDALRVLNMMTVRGEADIVSYGCAMNACARSGDVAGCEALHTVLLAERAAPSAQQTAESASTKPTAPLAPNEFTFGALVHACAEAAARERANGGDDADARATSVRWFRAGCAEARAMGGRGAEKRFVRTMLQLHDGRLRRALSTESSSQTATSAKRPKASVVSALPRHNINRGLVGARVSWSASPSASPRLQTALAAEATSKNDRSGGDGVSGGGAAAAAVRPRGRRSQRSRIRKQQTQLSALPASPSDSCSGPDTNGLGACGRSCKTCPLFEGSAAALP
jgi:pentatricopeptide repeat protein